MFNPGVSLKASRPSRSLWRHPLLIFDRICKNISLDLKDKGVVVSILHPGVVRTNMNPGGDGGAEAIEPDEAASKLYKVLIGKGMEDTGRFWHREGHELPW